MKLRIATEELTRALSRVQGIVERRSTNPIIANVLLDASKASLSVIATDTQVALSAQYPAQVSKQGRITVGARTLFEIARSIPADEIDLISDGDLLQVIGGEDNYQLRVMAADEFPPVPPFKGDQAFSIDVAILTGLIERCAFAISSDETRMGLNGAHLELNGKKTLRMVTTDGHRLCLSDTEIEEPGSFEPVLVGRKGLLELKRAMEGAEGLVKVAKSGSQLLFRFQETTFSTRLLEGQFPDYQQVIPDSWQRKVTLDRSEFVSVLKRVSILAPEKSNAVLFAIRGDKVVLESRHTELGTAKVPMSAEIDGKEIEIGFNARYFRDVLATMNGESVIIEVGDTLSPTVVRADNDEQSLFVIMPMRVE